LDDEVGAAGERPRALAVPLQQRERFVESCRGVVFECAQTTVLPDAKLIL
jgi:hypothetical protein